MTDAWRKQRVPERSVKNDVTAIPRFVPGRRGGISVVDAVVRALWNETRPSDRKKWPAKTFSTLAVEASSIVGYELTSSTVRSAIYGHMDLFEKDNRRDHLRWRLSEKARTA